MSSAPQAPQRRFAIRRDRDGCDECYDVVNVATNEVIATVPFWYEDRQSLRVARRIADALDALFDRGGRLHDKPLSELNQAVVREVYGL